MDWNRIDFGLVRSIARDTLGPAAAKHSRSLFIDIFLVFVGVKPAVLIDTFCADSTKMARYLMGIEVFLSHTRPRLPCQSLRVLDIEGDVIVIGDSRWSRMDAFIYEEDVRFVDASSSLKSPRWLDDVTRQSLLQWMSTVVATAETVDVEDDVKSVPISTVLVNTDEVVSCVPSLFGVLLGYPIIYYAPGDYNCLGLCPLTIISLKGVATGHIPHDCLTFSVPSHLYDDNGSPAVLLSSWQTRATACLSDVRRSVENVTRTSVTL